MIGILYESDEWSDWKLRDELEAALGEKVAMIDMEADDAIARALECELLVSRVFASAAFRGHERAHQAMKKLVDDPDAPPMINPARAHRFEISKHAAASELEAAGIASPRTQASGTPAQLREGVGNWSYPCIIKPDCGGRTTHTAILRSTEDARAFLDDAPPIEFVVEDLVEARAGFITRVEVVDGRIALVVKRSIAPSGLSSYHEGSTYELYPDVPHNVRDAVLRASELLDIRFGSFDVIEATDGDAYVIDANSVSNVSEDCTELFEMDLMRGYALALAGLIREDATREEPSC